MSFLVAARTFRSDARVSGLTLVIRGRRHASSLHLKGRLHSILVKKEGTPSNTKALSLIISCVINASQSLGSHAYCCVNYSGAFAVSVPSTFHVSHNYGNVPWLANVMLQFL